MNLVFERLAGSIHGMALHTSGIGIRLVQLRGPVSRSAPIVRVIIPDVVHAADFRENRAEHPIIGVADIAAFVAEIWIFTMNRSERRAVRICRVIRMNGHCMTRSAELAFRCNLEISHVARHGGCNG